MTITLELPDSQEKELREIASQRGQEPKAFLLSLIDEAILFEGTEPIPNDDSEEYAANVAALRRSIVSMEAGRYRPAAQVFADMEQRHGIPG